MAVASPALEYVARLVKKHAAIVLESNKDYLVEARLKPIAKELGFDGIDALLASMQLRETPELVNRVVEAMTTNETSFFRDMQPFEALRQHVLPAVLAKRAATRSLRIWSAASSTGQEAYSIAMLLEEHFPQLKDWDIRILGTDISSAVLAKAKAATFHQLEVNRGLPARFLSKYFVRSGMHWTLKDCARRRIEFRQMNLATVWPNLPTMDIIFVRNVLIYFDIETRRSILARMRQRLARDGYLFVGSTETTVNIDNAFSPAAFERSSCYVHAQP